MPERMERTPEHSTPELDRQVWGDNQVILHEGKSEGSWLKVDEDDLVPVTR